MSDIDINKEFESVGSKALFLSILEILFFVFTIIIVPFRAIIVVPIVIIILIIIMVFRILAIGSMKKANKILNQYRLEQSASKLISSTILFTVGTIFFMVGFMGIILLALRGILTIGQLIIGLFSIGIGIVLIFISGLIEYQGWDRLQIFFEQSQSSFPTSVADSGRTGSSLMKISGILNMTIVLIFIGSILRIIGYLKLTNLKKLASEPMSATPTAVSTPQPATVVPPPVTEPISSFCPNCGTKVSGGEKFCGACGSKL